MKTIIQIAAFNFIVLAASLLAAEAQDANKILNKIGFTP